MIELAGDNARATDSLFAQREALIAAKDHALEELCTSSTPSSAPDHFCRRDRGGTMWLAR